MPKEIDKNDVEISQLFKWKTKYSIKDSRGDPIKDIYMRIVGDAELNRARVYALRKSAELRRKLYEVDSDERLALIPELEFIDEMVLIESALLQWAKEYAQEAVKTLKFNIPVEPDSDASLEEQEQYQKEVDEWPSKREAAIREFMEKKLEEKRAFLISVPKEVVYKEYMKLLINRLCEDEMLNTFRDMNVYFGTFEDEACTKRLFESIEEFNDSSTELKTQLSTAYLSLEIDGENLKKLQEVTQ